MTKNKSFEYEFDLHQPGVNPSIEKLVNEAINQHQHGNTQQAEQIYRLILERDAENVHVLNMLGVLLSQKKQLAEGAVFLQEAVRLKPEVADYHVNLGMNFQERGLLEEAKKCMEKAVNLDGDSANTWFILGNIYLQQKNPKQAINAYQKAIENNSRFLPAYINLGNLFREMHRFDDAVRVFNKALSLSPESMQAWYNLGMTCKNMDDGDKAIKCFEKVIGYDPSNIKAICQAADCHGRLLNDMQTALNLYDIAIQANPSYYPAYLQKGDLLLTFGQYEMAENCFRQVLESEPLNANAYAGLINCNLYTDDDIQNLLDITERQNLPPGQSVDIQFALGKVFDKQKKFETAFHHFEKANRIHRGSYEYDVSSFEKLVSRVINKFDNFGYRRNSNAGADSELPVFIVGMPRSGTTLVEQILASHQMVYGAGELQYISNLLLGTVPLASLLDEAEEEVIPELTESEIHQCSSQYLAKLDKFRSDELRVTDKMPQNFIHLGYIASMFPKARIIHCLRHPLDTCVSIFTHKFTRHHPYAYNLTELGKYYLQYQKLMVHWQSLFGGRILTVKYEDLIAEPEHRIPELIQHIGLEWDEQCLQFFDIDRPVWTASHQQVRQKIYSESIGRWRHYQQWLQPLEAILENSCNDY